MESKAQAETALKYEAGSFIAMEGRFVCRGYGR